MLHFSASHGHRALHGLLAPALLAFVVCAVTAAPASAQPAGAIVVDNFESYEDGQRPNQWKYITRSRDQAPLANHLTEGREDIRVASENGNKFARAWTRNESVRFTRLLSDEYDWNVEDHPYLQWRWRLNDVPEGATAEDAGAGLLVTFDSDWLGRPKSIKYIYSSELSVGTVVDEGVTQTLVIASAQDGSGSWKTETRDVAADIERLFGAEPPYDELVVTLWSDSDEVHDTSEADFDDVRLLSQAQ